MRRSLAILLLFVLLACLSTYPLIVNLATQAPAGVASTYDGFAMIWNLWWFKHSLLDLNANPFVANGIFSPLGVNLYLHTYTVFSDLVAVPLLPWLSPVVASNLILIGSQALCGYGMYLLARFQTLGNNPKSAVFSLGSDGPAIIAGIVYAVTTSRFVFLQGSYNFFTTQWLPFYLLYLLKALRGPSRHTIFVAALFLVLALLVELSLGAMLALLSGLFWVLTTTFGPRMPSSASARRPWESVLIIATIFMVAFVLASPYLTPTVRESFDPRYIPQYWGGASVLSADLVGLFTPSSLSTFLGTHDWPREALEALQNKSRFVGMNIFVVGWGVGALALLAALVDRRARVWFWLALALVVLSLGPILHIDGRSEFDLDGMKVSAGLPYIVLHYVPVLNGLRAPHRFGVAAMIPLALLVGYAAAWIVGRFSQIVQA